MTTIFHNKTKFAIWAIPLDVVGSAREIEIGPGRKYEHESIDNTKPYAPYSEISLTEKMNDEGKREFKVEAERRKDFEAQKDAGLSLTVINDEMTNPRSYPSYREGMWVIHVPMGIELTLYNIDPCLKVSESAALVYVPVTAKKIFDSSRLEGFRNSTEGGYFQTVPRTPDEVTKIRNIRKKGQLESTLGITLTTKEPE